MVNYYEVLEVSEKASKEVIEKAYKILAKKYHPDLNKDNPHEAEAKMKQLNEAYEILMDDQKRANFDNVLQKKRELEIQKQYVESLKNKQQSTTYANQTSSQSSNTNHGSISYSNSGNYYTDKNDNFYVNTSNMDDKTRKKIQNKIQERYLEAYDSYLRERGYKLKYKWTFKRVITLILAVLITILILVILYFIPPINSWCHALYNENPVVRVLTNLVVAIFSAIFKGIKSIFVH